MLQLLLAFGLQAMAAIPEVPADNAPGAIIQQKMESNPSYDIALNYSILDQHFGVPAYTITEGEGASLIKESNGKKYYLDMLAANEPEDTKSGKLRMVFLAGILNPNGTKTQISRTALVARLGKTSRLSVANEEGKTEMSLAITARPKASK